MCSLLKRKKDLQKSEFKAHPLPKMMYIEKLNMKEV